MMVNKSALIFIFSVSLLSVSSSGSHAQDASAPLMTQVNSQQLVWNGVLANAAANNTPLAQAVSDFLTSGGNQGIEGYLTIILQAASQASPADAAAIGKGLGQAAVALAANGQNTSAADAIQHAVVSDIASLPQTTSQAFTTAAGEPPISANTPSDV